MYMYIQYTVCTCVYPIHCTGHETKALLNNSGARAKRSKLEKDINAEIFSQVLVLFLLCLIGAISESVYMYSSDILIKHMFMYNV